MKPRNDPRNEIAPVIIEPLEPYLNSFINYERYKYFPKKVNLNDYKRFLQKIGNPQKDLSPSILIAGTNGKGSTAAIISSILCSEGYKVGLFTSPHLFSFRERLQICGKNISRRDYNHSINMLKPYLDEPYQKARRTFFEVLTTVAFLHFKNKKTDINIFEVGLGGRLDATNVVKPLVSVITPIGFDHTRTLGRTLGKIAWEKCGIVRNGGTVISALQPGNAEKSIERITRERGAQLFTTREHVKIKKESFGKEGIHFMYGNGDYFIPFKGRFQLKNLRTALLTVEILEKKGFTVSKDALKRGLRNAVWKGRLDIVSQKPLIVLDGAHNPSAMREMLKSLKELFPHKKIILIFSCLISKNRRAMISLLEKRVDKIILTRIDTERAVDIKSLKKVFRKNVLVTDNIESAFKISRRLTNKNSFTLVTGSIYLVAEAYKTLYHPFLPQNIV